MSKWLEQFNENYYGRSPQAKELEQFMKSNYQGRLHSLGDNGTYSLSTRPRSRF